jgi:NTE family protein
MSTKKVALVLAGGGVTGVAFEVGVLRAINEVWLNRSVNTFDMYVGTSAGAFIASLLASGIPLNTLYHRMREDMALFGECGPVATLFPNVAEVVEKSVFFPFTLLHATGAFFKSNNLLTGVRRAAEELLPSGLFDTRFIQQYLYRMYRKHGVGNDMQNLPYDLHIVVTDLENGDRTVFNRANPAPLEKAVAASCALPLIYRPVRINGRDYIDGGMRGTASIDLAVEEGADLVIVVNPMVPYDNRPESDGDYERGEPGGHLVNRGPMAVSNQITRAALHGGLLYHTKQVKRHHPHVNIMLIEPHPTDPTLAFRGMMSYEQVREVAHYGFTVGMDFWKRNEAQAREVLAARGIQLATRIPEMVTT